MPGKKLGLDCKLFRNSGTYNNATWNEITNVVDLDHTNSAAEGDISSRASRWKKTRPGLMDASLTFGLRYDSADEDHQAIRGYYFNNGLIDTWVADGSAATNTQGPRAWMIVTEFSHSQPLEDGVMCNVSMRPSNDATNTEDPTWFNHA